MKRAITIRDSITLKNPHDADIGRPVGGNSLELENDAKNVIYSGEKVREVSATLESDRLILRIKAQVGAPKLPVNDAQMSSRAALPAGGGLNWRSLASGLKLTFSTPLNADEEHRWAIRLSSTKPPVRLVVKIKRR